MDIQTTLLLDEIRSKLIQSKNSILNSKSNFLSISLDSSIKNSSKAKIYQGLHWITFQISEDS